MHAMNDAPTPRANRVKDSYTSGARTLASRSVTGLARTRVTPNVLTAGGVTPCLAAAVLVPFGGRDRLLFYWLRAPGLLFGSGLARLGRALAPGRGEAPAFCAPLCLPAGTRAGARA